MVNLPRQRRATLFVAGLVLDGLPAALASGADIVCVDLEDAVPLDRKDQARAAMVAAVAHLEAPANVQLIVRINGLGSFEGPVDLRAAILEAPPVTGIMLPKVESAEEVRWAGELADDTHSQVDLYAIIETAEALENAAAIARAHPRLKALFFGGFDLSTALGCAMAWEPLLYARSRVVHAAAMARIEVIDSPFAGVGDDAGLRAACERAKALGITGKAAKDARQVAVIRDAFTPTPQEIERARTIVGMFHSDPTRPLVYEGKLVELPTIKRLERIAQLPTAS
jgi:citrate lyase beta subunit